MPFRLSEATVAIVGLGLMGGSLAAALSRSHSCKEVVGIARRGETLRGALELRYIQRGTTDLQEGVGGADVVILATPVRDIIEKVNLIGPWLRPGTVLFDLGSTKREVVRGHATLARGDRARRRTPHVRQRDGRPRRRRPRPVSGQGTGARRAGADRPLGYDGCRGAGAEHRREGRSGSMPSGMMAWWAW